MTPRERNIAAIDEIAVRHGITRHEILGSDLRPHVCIARSECAKHFRAQDKSLPAIGRILGRHHTTVLNMIAGKRHRLERKANGQFAKYSTADNARTNAHSRAGARNSA